MTKDFADETLRPMNATKVTINCELSGVPVGPLD